MMGAWWVPGPVRRVPGCGAQASAAGGEPGEVELKTLGSGKTHVLRERELCSDARKLADAGKHTVEI